VQAIESLVDRSEAIPAELARILGQMRTAMDTPSDTVAAG